jgi:hypothetical protein
MNAIDDLKIGLYVEPEQPICTVALVIRTLKHSRLSIEVRPYPFSSADG